VNGTWIDLLEHGEAEWNRFWIPMTHDEGSNYYCLNLDPHTDDQFGQIIYVEHETVPKTEVIASSLSQFLEQFEIDLEAGVFEYAEEFECLVDAEELNQRQFGLSRKQEIIVNGGGFA
jgi:cell wall assembly regulator SMI1